MDYRQDIYGRENAGLQSYDAIDPLLVDLHDSMNQFKKDKTEVSNRLSVMDSVAKILDAKLSNQGKSLASEVLLSLVKQAEVDIRISLSERLAHRNDVPSSLVHYLAYDVIDVAEPMLLRSPLLKDMDLIYIIQSKAKEFWQIIAKREKISERVVANLIEKKDEKTAINLLKNDSIEIAEPYLQKMKSIALKSVDVAEEFVCYKALPREMAVEIYWHVSVSIRNYIAETFDFKTSELDKALEDCVQDFSDTILQASTMRPSTLMIDVAEMYNKENKISDYFLVNTLRRRQGRFFIALMAKRTKLSHETIWNMMRQVGGQGLAVACRALNITKENFVSIFLLSRTITQSRDAVNADELRMAMRYYDGLTHKMAKEILIDSIAT